MCTYERLFKLANARVLTVAFLYPQVAQMHSITHRQRPNRQFVVVLVVVFVIVFVVAVAVYAAPTVVVVVVVVVFSMKIYAIEQWIYT